MVEEILEELDHERRRQRAASPPPLSGNLPDPRAARRLRNALVRWYEHHRRDLPWRRTRDPYAIWVSEIMLQQTQVATVRDYYSRWMRRFPTVGALARADEQSVLHAWQGLGYYSRARNLWRAARCVTEEHGETVPGSFAELLTLPGVGRYSAAAIASIAYGEAVPVVDGNVVRVLCRLFALRGDPTRSRAQKLLFDLAARMLVPGRAADSNQALMELGATVCTPRVPACTVCPLRRDCVARRENAVRELPELPSRRRTVPVHRVACLAARRGRFLVIQLPDDAPRWASMWQFPNGDVLAREAPDRVAQRALRETTGLAASGASLERTLHHSVTHYRIRLDVYDCGVPSGRANPKACRAVAWKRPAELDALPMPAVHRRIARMLQRE